MNTEGRIYLDVKCIGRFISKMLKLLFVHPTQIIQLSINKLDELIIPSDMILMMEK